MRSLALLAGLSLVAARAVAELGKFANSSSTPAQCPGTCTVNGPPASWISWQSAPVTSIVAATLVYIIDNGTNTTSTSTISLDTSALPERVYPPQRTNAGGTVVTTTTFAGTEIVLAYPTEVKDYGSSYSVWGQYESTGADNIRTCVNQTDTADPPITALPSHPPIIIPVETPLNGDAFGRNFIPVLHEDNVDFQVLEMFPDIGVFHSCETTFIAPAVLLKVASFLTESSTSYVSSPATSTAGKPAGSVDQPPSQPPTPQATAAVPAETPGKGATPTALIVSSQTPGPGGPVITLPSATTVAGSSTVPIIGNGGMPAVLTIGSQILTPGGPAITVSGTVISLAPGATAVVVGSSTVPIIGNSGMPTVLTVGGLAITLPGTTAVVVGSSTVPIIGNGGTPTVLTVGGQTIVPGGPAITVSGTRVSLAPGATNIVIGTSTVPINSIGGSATDTASGSAYTGPFANGAARMNYSWRELLTGTCLVIWWAFCRVPS